MALENETIFENLKRVAAVAVQMLGQNCEVAIHDFSKLPHSLVHIEGKVTKRQVGAPITDLVIKRLRAEGDAVRDISSYRTVTREGRILKSSTTFIRDKSGTVIGAYCANFDITDHLNAVTLLNEFVQTDMPASPEKKETFASSLDETIESLMAPVIKEIGKQPVTMSKEERIRLVQALEFQGGFMLRGAVDYLAKIMGVSKYTVYNYLKEIRAEGSTP